MASFAAKTLLALAVSATAIVPLNAAHADEWRHRNRDAALVLRTHARHPSVKGS